MVAIGMMDSLLRPACIKLDSHKKHLLLKMLSIWTARVSTYTHPDSSSWLRRSHMTEATAS